MERPKSQIDFSVFHLAILRAGINYSFHRNRSKSIIDFDGPFSEYACLEIDAECIYPFKFAGDRFSLEFLPNKKAQRFLENPRLEEEPGSFIGEINVRGSNRQFLGGMPDHRLFTICDLVDRKKVGEVALTGGRLFRGKSSIFGVSFKEKIQPDEYY